MKQNKDKDTHKYDRLLKGLQILSFAFMAVMLVVCVIFITKNKISVNNVDAITKYLTGGTLTVAVIIIAFTVIKSFALVFPPIIIYFVSGLVFDNALLAIGVNIIGSALSLILPYYLGRFTGKDMLISLEKKYKTVKKLENFTNENTFAVVFAFKAGGLLPSDLSSVIFGAMNIPFMKYFISSNLGLLVLNVCWSLIGVLGDFSDPMTYVYLIPIGICLVGSLEFMRRAQKKNEKAKESK